MAKVRILITGKVQGVFFRHSARQQAQALQIGGWVKNLPDGAVLTEAVGDTNSLMQYISWCKQGPAHAQVTNTVIEWLENSEDRLLLGREEEFYISD